MFPAHFARLAARSRRGFQALILALAAFSAACAPGETPVAPSANPLLEPFVGTWDATVLTIRSVADTSIVVDLLENGVSYISIYESGNYQSTIAFGGTPFTEFGAMEVSAGVVTLRPNNADPVTRTYQFTSADHVRLEGPTDWDFNLDTVDDPATLVMEMRKR